MNITPLQIGLHQSIKRAKVFGPAAHWPDQPAAPLNATELGDR